MIFKLSSILATALILSPPLRAFAAEADVPNINLEKRVYRNYSKSNTVSNAQWAKMVGKKKEEVYIAQPGDTLASISKTLFGDSSYWPKLWAQNQNLGNPNVLKPGMGIRLISGTTNDAPKAEVVSAEVARMIRLNPTLEFRGRQPTYREQALRDLAPDEVFDQNGIEVDELVDAPEIPGPKRKSRKVLEVLPPSFKSIVVKNFVAYDKTGLDIGKRPSYNKAAIVIPNSYLSDGDPESIGKVIEIEVQEKVASLGQNVFVKLEREAKIGEKLAIIFPKGKISDPQRGALGPVVEIEGIVEIFEVADADKNTYLAQVIKVVNPIRVNALVSDAPLPRGTYGKSGTRVNVDVRIVGGEFDEKRTTFGDSSVVYLDGGSDDGLSAGDVLAVKAKRGVRVKDSTIPDWSYPVGLLKIVKVEPSVSTAFVMQISEELHPGDQTGGAAPEGARAVHEEILDDMPPAEKKTETEDIE